MLRSKVTVWLIAATMLLSTGLVLYSESAAHAAKFWARS